MAEMKLPDDRFQLGARVVQVSGDRTKVLFRGVVNNTSYTDKYPIKVEGGDSFTKYGMRLEMDKVPMLYLEEEVEVLGNDVVSIKVAGTTLVDNEARVEAAMEELGNAKDAEELAWADADEDTPTREIPADALPLYKERFAVGDTVVYLVDSWERLVEYTSITEIKTDEETSYPIRTKGSSSFTLDGRYLVQDEGANPEHCKPVLFKLSEVELYNKTVLSITLEGEVIYKAPDYDNLKKQRDALCARDVKVVSAPEEATPRPQLTLIEGVATTEDVVEDDSLYSCSELVVESVDDTRLMPTPDPTATRAITADNYTPNFQVGDSVRDVWRWHDGTVRAIREVDGEKQYEVLFPAEEFSSATGIVEFYDSHGRVWATKGGGMPSLFALNADISLVGFAPQRSIDWR